jgi:hypothetical protein
LESRPLRVEPVPFLWAMVSVGCGVQEGWRDQARAVPPTLMDFTITRVSSWR